MIPSKNRTPSDINMIGRAILMRVIAIAVTLIKIVFPIISILLGFLILLVIVCIIVYINF